MATLLGGLLYVLASFVGAYAALAGEHRRLPVPAGEIGPDHEDVRFTSRVDGLRLNGWLFRSPRGDGRSVILVHGWHGDREDVNFAPLARDLLRQGFDVLMFDMRASGTSQGFTQTFAHQEPRDLLGAYDFMLSRGYAPQRMAILGNSMGAATVIEAAPQLAHVGALVCDSAFAALTPTLEAGFRNDTRLPALFAAPLLAFSGILGVDLSLRPVDVVRSLPHRAFLFIQARGDDLVPPGDAPELRRASANPASQLLMLDGHAHLDTYSHDPATYMAHLLAFIRAQLGSAWEPAAAA